MSRHALRLIKGIIDMAIERAIGELSDQEREELDYYLVRELGRHMTPVGYVSDPDDPELCSELESKLRECLEEDDCRRWLEELIDWLVRDWARERKGKREAVELLMYA